MTSCELRNQYLDKPAIYSEAKTQLGEAERKSRKLAYQQSRSAGASAQEICRAGSLAGEPVARPASSEPRSSASTPNPDLFDEFSAGEQLEMMAIRARVHARARLTSSQEPIAQPESRSDEPAALSETKTQVDEPAALSEAKTQRGSGPTGPRSPEGKATSSGNSLKHGLASGRLIIPGEDPAEFEALLADLIAEATETEALLVQQMAESWWLMQRAIRLQNESFAGGGVDTHKLALFLRYQTTYERAFYKALNLLIKLKKERRKATPEFVSQKPQQTLHTDEFVSQKRPGTQSAGWVRFAKRLQNLGASDF